MKEKQYFGSTANLYIKSPVLQICCLMIVMHFNCNTDQKSFSDPIRKMIYTEDLHSGSPDIFTADSLILLENYDHSSGILQQSISIYEKDTFKRYHIQSGLLLTEKDSTKSENLYQELLSEFDRMHIISRLRLIEYMLNTHKDITAFLPTLKEDLNADIPSYYQAITAFFIAKCNTGIISELDTTWYYIRLAFEKFEENRMITPAFQECVELLTVNCTYYRQNLLAIRYANVLFEFDRYLPVADDVDKARAFSCRAFMLYREGDFNGTNEDIAHGLNLIQAHEHPEIYQNLLKSELVAALYKKNDSLWESTAKSLDSNILISGKDYIGLDRWKGHYYTYLKRFVEAIPYLQKALDDELLHNKSITGTFSTLCFLLSDCYEGLNNFEMALKYMSLNTFRSLDYDKGKMLQHIKSNSQYTFVIAIRCAEIYYRQFVHTKSKGALLSAKEYLEVVDQIVYEQFNTMEESAVLRFYFESGQAYFNLGMHVNYDLWMEYRDSMYINKLTMYSEKNKNSLMQRDMMMAGKMTSLPEVLVNQEVNIRAAIKKEKNTGLRSNLRFNQLIDEYSTIEKEIERYHPDFIDNSLVFNLSDIEKIQSKMKNNQTSILIIDEVDDYWYYILINRQKVSVNRKLIDNHDIIKIDTLFKLLKGDLVIAEDKKPILSKQYRNEIFPKNILENLSDSIILISECVFSRIPFKGFFLDHTNFSISHAPSVRLLIMDKKDKCDQGKTAVFAFSDPETIRDEKPTFLSELPGTYLEAVKIGKLHPDAILFTGKKATKANFLTAYQNPNISYIHLAVHGVANSSTKDEVKLYFRTDSGGTDSLYGYELLRYKSHCKKIVLSACQSGLGLYVSGEGKYSLPRYFIINGAQEVKASLWDIEDHLDFEKQIFNTISVNL